MDDSFIQQLNSKQQEAVKATEGYIRVVAGPGSGKTRTLVNRYAYLYKNCGISSNNLLCITFTNKAALVMKNRLKSFFGNSFSGNIYTFHGLCAKILRNEIFHLNFPKNFTIIDASDVESIYKNIYEKLSISKSDMKYSELTKAIYFYKKNNIFEYIDYITDVNFSKVININQEIIEYLNYQRKNYYLDFNDLIFFTLYILEKYNDVLEKYQTQFQYIQVDEFQDVTEKEFELVQLLAAKNNNLFVVGDPDQMIYSWRGAKDFITCFDEIYPNCRTIYLDKNYRSTPEIISVTNDLIKHNENRLDKNMITDNPSLKVPTYFNGKNKTDESLWICKTIKKLHELNTSYDDIAVIYRANHNSRYIEDALLKENIPYKICGDIGFYDRVEIKDLISYLRLLINFDDLSFLRIINKPTRNIGKKKIDYLKDIQKTSNKSLFELAKEKQNDNIFKGSKIKEFFCFIDEAIKMKDMQPVSEILSFIYQKSGYENELLTQDDETRLENVNELFNSIKNYEINYGEKLDLVNYIEWVSLVTSTEDINEEKNDNIGKVKLMTAHAAKGQEFPFVFVCSLNENIFPSAKSNTLKEMQEERRLAYVAFTRAEKHLFLSSYNGSDYNMNFVPSRFIFEINKNQITFEGEKISALQIETLKSICNNSIKSFNFPTPNKGYIGRIVLHSIFGKGVIVNVDEKNNKLTIKFDGLSTNRDIDANCQELNIANQYKEYNNDSAFKQHIETNIVDDMALLTVTQIVSTYGLSRYRVMKLIHSGKLPTIKHGNKFLIKQADLDKYFLKQKIYSIICILLLVGFITFLISTLISYSKIN